MVSRVDMQTHAWLAQYATDNLVTLSSDLLTLGSTNVDGLPGSISLPTFELIANN